MATLRVAPQGDGADPSAAVSAQDTSAELLFPKGQESCRVLRCPHHRHSAHHCCCRPTSCRPQPSQSRFVDCANDSQADKRPVSVFDTVPFADTRPAVAIRSATDTSIR